MESILHELSEMLIPIAICVVLPLVLAWLYYRNRQHTTDKRSEIVMAAIEKNADIDVQDFLSKLNPPQKSFREKMQMALHAELLWGSMLTIAGGMACLVILCLVIFFGFKDDDIPAICIFGLVPLAVGAGLLIAHFNGKKMLEKAGDQTA